MTVIDESCPSFVTSEYPFPETQGPASKGEPSKKKSPGQSHFRRFTEGWIEFLSKRVAKEVAVRLNNTAVGGNKRSKAHDVLWNIKYLPR